MYNNENALAFSLFHVALYYYMLYIDVYVHHVLYIRQRVFYTVL